MVGQDKNRLTVSIYGQNYTIVGNESSEYIRTLAGIVEEKMHRVGQGNARLDTVKLAILSAINIADDYYRLLQKVEELEKRLEEKD